jgi:hypothetical protein
MVQAMTQAEIEARAGVLMEQIDTALSLGVSEDDKGRIENAIGSLLVKRAIVRFQAEGFAALRKLNELA